MRIITFLIALLFITIFCVAHSTAQCDVEESFQAVGTHVNDNLGFSSANWCDKIAVGVPDRHGDAGGDVGAVELYRRVNDEWILEVTLIGGDGGGGVARGHSVDIYKNLIVSGAIGEDNNGVRSGAAYVFEEVEGEWIETAMLTPSIGADTDFFGWSSCATDGVIVVGAPRNDHNGSDAGAVFVFEKIKGQWIETAMLAGADTDDGDRFGNAVSIWDNTIAIGAQRDRPNGSRSGSAYIFQKVSGKWVETAKIIPSNSISGAEFGNAVSIYDNLLAVGSYLATRRGFESGLAYIFRHENGEWIEEQQIIGDDSQEQDEFGTSVALFQNTLLVGAPWDDDADYDGGSAYLFKPDENSGYWKQVNKIIGSNVARYHRFGNSASLWHDYAVIGSYIHSSRDEPGTAYFYDLGCQPSAELTGLEITSGSLIDGKLADLEESDGLELHLLSGFGVTFAELHRSELLVRGHNTVSSPCCMRIMLTSRIDQPSGTAKLGLRNWNTNQFDTLSVRTVGIDSSRLSAECIDVSDYINQLGEIEVSVVHLVFVPFFAFTFESFVDQVEISVN